MPEKSPFRCVAMRPPTTLSNCSGASMDLAMAMGLSLFGIFAGSTVFFFYRLPR